MKLVVHKWMCVEGLSYKDINDRQVSLWYRWMLLFSAVDLVNHESTVPSRGGQQDGAAEERKCGSVE